MRVDRRRLPNGLRIAVAPISELRTTAVLLAIEAGQWFEPEGRPGVARLAAQTMLRGTQQRSADEWSDAIDALGAVARLDVGSHAATFSAQCLGDDLASLLGLMSEALRTPRLAPEDVEFVRGQTLAQLERDERDTRAVVERVWREHRIGCRPPLRETRGAPDESADGQGRPVTSILRLSRLRSI